MVRVVFIALWITLLFPTAPSATLLDFIGVNNSVNNAAEQLRQSVIVARDALLTIESKTNEDVKDRLKQVDDIVSNAMNRIHALQDATTSNVLQILEEANSRYLE
jgi:hypothetical protein